MIFTPGIWDSVLVLPFLRPANAFVNRLVNIVKASGLRIEPASDHVNVRVGFVIMTVNDAAGIWHVEGTQDPSGRISLFVMVRRLIRMPGKDDVEKGFLDSAAVSSVVLHNV